MLGSHAHRRARPHRPKQQPDLRRLLATSSPTPPTSSTSPTSTPAAGPAPRASTATPGTADDRLPHPRQTPIGANYAGPAAGPAADAPFSVAELERTLRIFDEDASRLPDRLARLAGIIYPNDPPLHSANPNHPDGHPDVADRMRLTTDSFDLPTPNVSLPHEMEPLLTANPQPRRLPRSVAELIEMRIRQSLLPVRFVRNPDTEELSVDLTNRTRSCRKPRSPIPASTQRRPKA